MSDTYVTKTVASSTYATKEEISKSGSKVLEGKVTLPDTYELSFDVIKKDKIYTPNVDEDQLVLNPTAVYITVEGTPGEEGSGDGSWEDVKPADWYNIALSTDAIGGTTRYFTYTTSNNARLSSAATVIGTKNVIPTDAVQEALNSYGIDVVAGDQIRLTVASGYATAAFIWNSDTMAVDGTPAYVEGTRTITIANGYNKIGIVLKKTSDTAISTTDAENLAIEKYIPGSVTNDGTDKTKPIKLSTFRNNLTVGAYNNDNIKLVFLNKCNLYTEKSTFALLNTTDSLKNLMITGENAMTWIGLGQDAVWTASSTAGCYQVECTTKVSDLADVEHLTALGMPKLYKKLSTVSAVAAEKGTFCQVNNIVTVNPYDATPINDIKLIYGLDYASTDKGVIAIEKATAGNVVFKDMGFLLDTLNVSNLKSLNCALWFFNCGFHRNSQDSIGFNGLYQAYLVNCVADYASKDCFNYHSTSKDCIAVEFNCISYGAGQYKLDTTGHNTTTDSNNGSTAHNGLTIMRFGCQYWDCEGAIIADVHNCKVLNMECVAKHVLPTITSTNYNAIFMMHDNRNATSSGINKKYREDTHTNYIICCGGLDARNKYDIEGMTVEISGYDTDITSSYTVDETITNSIKYY